MPEWKKNQIVDIEYADCVFRYKLKEQLTPMCWDGYLLDENDQVRFHDGGNPIVHVVCNFKEKKDGYDSRTGCSE